MFTAADGCCERFNSYHLVLNPAFCKLAGRTESELLERHFSEAFPESGNCSYISMLDRVHITGVPEILDDQDQATDPASSWSFSCWPISGRSDGPNGVMVQVADTTVRVMFRKRSTEMNQSLMTAVIREHEITANVVQLNRELQAVAEARTRFFTTMSREIKTPINVIAGFSDLLSLPNQTGAEQKKVWRPYQSPC